MVDRRPYRPTSSTDIGLPPDFSQQSVVSKLLPSIQALMRSVPADQRATLGKLWSTIRPVILDLEAGKETAILEAHRLRLQLEKTSGVATESSLLTPSSSIYAARPSSTSSVNQAKLTFDDMFAEHINLLKDGDSASLTQRQIRNMPPDIALKILQPRRDDVTEAINNPNGCWLKVSDINRYPKVNLRNTLHHSGTGTYGQVYLHYLAVVAAGRGNTLCAVSSKPRDGTQFHVSHLYNNERCFNPDHVHVEAANVNEARKTCFGRSHIDCSGFGAVYNICPHARLVGSCAKDCILPRFKGRHGAYHKAVHDGYVAIPSNKE